MPREPSARRTIHVETLRIGHWARSYVRPLFVPDHKDGPRLIGSSVLVRVGSQHFLVTAAHVFDECRKATLNVGADDLVPITGIGCTTALPPGGRAADRIDLAVIPILDDRLVNNCRFVAVDEFDLDPRARSKLYVAVGYHGREWRRYDVKSVASPGMAYAGVLADLSICEGLGISESTHLAIRFHRSRVLGSEGVQVAPDPHGMSGGAFWRVDTTAEGSMSNPRLAGIGIEYHGRPIDVLVATRSFLVLEIIRHAHPELRDQLPEPRHLKVTARDRTR